jgi:hypothetical protein
MGISVRRDLGDTEHHPANSVVQVARVVVVEEGDALLNW